MIRKDLYRTLFDLEVAIITIECINAVLIDVRIFFHLSEIILLSDTENGKNCATGTQATEFHGNTNLKQPTKLRVRVPRAALRSALGYVV